MSADGPLAHRDHGPDASTAPGGNANAPASRWRELIATVAVLAAAAFVVLVHRRPGFAIASFDIYAYFHVNVFHALRSVHDGGQGLLWNPWQNCGQPFFANSLTGLLYPPHLLFLLFGPDAGLRAVTIVNLAVAGLGAYALARTLGLTRAAALAGALAFELGNGALFVATWSPMHSGPYAWFPLALLLAERLLKKPSARLVWALAGVLTVALLPGFPQTVMFIYQLIGLRVLWALLWRECERPLETLAAVAAALVLPLLLGAVQLLPSIEFAAESIRSTPLSEGGGQLAGVSWTVIGDGIARRLAGWGPFLLASTCLAAAALGSVRERRSQVLFYFLAGLIFFALAFGPGTPLFDLYSRLPFATIFRFPHRFLWPADFCLAVLVAFGVEALSRRGTSNAPFARAVPLGLALATALAFGFVLHGGLALGEWLALSPLAFAALAAVLPALAPAVGPALVLAVVLNLALAPPFGLFAWKPSGESLFGHAAIFEDLRARIGSPYRLALVTSRESEFALIQKTATIFEARAIWDYEPQVSRRYTDYFTMMRTARPVATVEDAYYAGLNWFPAGSNRRLFDLTGARYVVAKSPLEGPKTPFRSPPLVPMASTSGTAPPHLYENPHAVPRALHVRRIEVVADPQQLLGRLAAGKEDPRQVAFVEAPPASGFAGAAGGGEAGNATIVVDEPEHVVVEVESPAGGFLLLADQYYPGWEANVGGRPVEILRANYVFRLVEVPQGVSRVEFRFRPRSLQIGAGVTLVTLLAMAVSVFAGRERREV